MEGTTTTFEGLLDDALRRGFVAAVRLLGDRDAAREACQEAAARALAARNSYKPEKAFYPWFHRILRNHCFDLLERRARLVQGGEVERVSPLCVEQTYIRSEEERALLAAVSMMEPDLREIIELRHFQDLSYREMADVLECPEGTVMSRLYRARRRLRDLLLSQGPLERGRRSRS